MHQPEPGRFSGPARLLVHGQWRHREQPTSVLTAQHTDLQQIELPTSGLPGCGHIDCFGHHIGAQHHHPRPSRMWGAFGVGLSGAERLEIT